MLLRRKLCDARARIYGFRWDMGYKFKPLPVVSLCEPIVKRIKNKWWKISKNKSDHGDSLSYFEWQEKKVHSRIS